jgi:hypothetical protein
LIAAALSEHKLGHSEQATRLSEQGVASLEKLTGARAQIAAFPEPAWDYSIQRAMYAQDGATLIVVTDRDTRLYRAKDVSLLRVIPRQGQQTPRVVEQDGQLSVHDGDVVSTWLLPNGWFLGVSKAPSKVDSSGRDEPKSPSQRCVGRYRDARLPTVCVTEAPHYRLINEERQNCDGRALESTTWFQAEGGPRISLVEATTATCGSADWFLAGSAGLELRRASTGAVLVKLSEGDGYFEQLLCNPMAHRVAALEAAKLRVWSVPQGDLVASLPAEQVAASSLLVPKEGNAQSNDDFWVVGFSDSAQRLVGFDKSNRIVVADLVLGTSKIIAELPERSVYKYLLRDGSLLAERNKVLLWIDPKTGLVTRRVHYGGSFEGALQNGELTLIFGKPTVLTSSRLGIVTPEKWPASAIRSAAFSLDGTLVALGEQDGTVSLCHTSRAGCVARLPVSAPMPGFVRALAFDSKAQRLAASSEGTVSIWDVPRRALIARFDGCEASLLAFNATGEHLMAPPCQISLANGSVTRPEFMATHRPLSLSSDGRLLVGNEGHGSLGIWDIERKRRVLSVTLRAQMRSAYALTPEGRVKWFMGAEHAPEMFYCRVGPVALPWEACRSRLETDVMPNLISVAPRSGAK